MLASISVCSVSTVVSGGRESARLRSPLPTGLTSMTRIS